MIIFFIIELLFLGYLITIHYDDEIEGIIIETIYKTELSNNYDFSNNNSSIRNFKDLKELMIFLSEDTTDEINYSNNFDCDDFAFTLQRNAFLKGYKLDVQIIDSKTNNKYFKDKLKDKQIHMINMAVVGSGIYYIEPQTDEIERICFIDIKYNFFN